MDQSVSQSIFQFILHPCSHFSHTRRSQVGWGSLTRVRRKEEASQRRRLPSLPEAARQDPVGSIATLWIGTPTCRAHASERPRPLEQFFIPLQRPVLGVSRLFKRLKGHRMHRFENSGVNQLRKTPKREVEKESKLPQTLYLRAAMCAPPRRLRPGAVMLPLPYKNRVSLFLGGGEFWACPLSLGLSWLMFEDKPPFLGRYRVP